MARAGADIRVAAEHQSLGPSADAAVASADDGVAGCSGREGIAPSLASTGGGEPIGECGRGVAHVERSRPYEGESRNVGAARGGMRGSRDPPRLPCRGPRCGWRGRSSHTEPRRWTRAALGLPAQGGGVCPGAQSGGAAPRPGLGSVALPATPLDPGVRGDWRGLVGPPAGGGGEVRRRGPLADLLEGLAGAPPPGLAGLPRSVAARLGRA